MLGKTKAEIEAVFGWPEGVTEEEMKADLRRSVGGAEPWRAGWKG